MANENQLSAWTHWKEPIARFKEKRTVLYDELKILEEGQLTREGIVRLHDDVRCYQQAYDGMKGVMNIADSQKKDIFFPVLSQNMAELKEYFEGEKGIYELFQQGLSRHFRQEWRRFKSLAESLYENNGEESSELKSELSRFTLEYKALLDSLDPEYFPFLRTKVSLLPFLKKKIPSFIADYAQIASIDFSGKRKEWEARYQGAADEEKVKVQFEIRQDYDQLEEKLKQVSAEMRRVPYSFRLFPSSVWKLTKARMPPELTDYVRGLGETAKSPKEREEVKGNEKRIEAIVSEAAPQPFSQPLERKAKREEEKKEGKDIVQPVEKAIESGRNLSLYECFLELTQSY